MTTTEQPMTRTELREELHILRDEMREYYATKQDLAELETRLIKWMVGLMVASSAVATSLALLIQRLIGT